MIRGSQKYIFANFRFFEKLWGYYVEVMARIISLSTVVLNYLRKYSCTELSP